MTTIEPNARARIQVGILDHEQYARLGLAALLRRSGFAVVWEARTVAEASERMQARPPHHVVVDGGLGGDEGLGLDFVAATRPARPQARFVVTTSQRAGFKGMVRSASEVGADGFVAKAACAEVVTIDRVILAVEASGRCYCRQAQSVLDELQRFDPFAEFEPVDFAILAAKFTDPGLLAKEIAARLHLAETLVTTRKTRMLKKANCRKDTQLLQLAHDWWPFVRRRLRQHGHGDGRQVAAP